MFFILTQLKLIFPRKVLHLAFLYLPKTFLVTRDVTVTYRWKETLLFFVVVFHTYIVVFVESENRRCRWVGLIAGQKISSVLACKRNLQVAHNSYRFHLFCIRLERPCRKPGQWLPKRQQETNKQTKQIKKKKQLSACFLRVSAVILLSWFVGWVNLIGIHFQQTNLYRRFTKLISSYDLFTRYRVANNDESVHVDRLKN